MGKQTLLLGFLTLASAVASANVADSHVDMIFSGLALPKDLHYSFCAGPDVSAALVEATLVCAERQGITPPEDEDDEGYTSRKRNKGRRAKRGSKRDPSSSSKTGWHSKWASSSSSSSSEEEEEEGQQQLVASPLTDEEAIAKLDLKHCLAGCEAQHVGWCPHDEDVGEEDDQQGQAAACRGVIHNHQDLADQLESLAVTRAGLFSPSAAVEACLAEVAEKVDRVYVWETIFDLEWSEEEAFETATTPEDFSCEVVEHAKTSKFLTCLHDAFDRACLNFISQTLLPPPADDSQSKET